MRSRYLFGAHTLLSLLIFTTSAAFFGCKKADPPPPQRRKISPPPQPPRRVEAPKPAPQPRNPEDSYALPPVFNFERDGSVLDMANWLSTRTATVMMRTLRQEMAGGSIEKAIQTCQKTAGHIERQFGKSHNATVQRISHRNRNPANLASSDEMKLIRQLKQKIAMDSPTLHTLLPSEDKKTKTVYLPILVAMPTCLKCHGSPTKDIEPETLALLKKYYPQDRATGFRIGDVRGMWKITFQKSP
ncbi:DUF3365 domain-containing protein [Myxococcota bacterium]|nr:DUF3365 domain-containing protein [Myxococcota bacterium]